MPEFFELSIISQRKADLKLWEEKLALRLGKSVYSGRLNFFNDRNIILNEYDENSVWQYELSVNSIGLFSRDNIINKIVILLEAVNEIGKNCDIEYAIGNIETNNSFISSNANRLNPSKEIILKSSLIFIPEQKLTELEISIYHVVFRLGKTICLYNPTSGILYSSQSEGYKILRESFLKNT